MSKSRERLIWESRGGEWKGKRGNQVVAFVIQEHDEWNVYSPEEENADKPGRLEAANVGSFAEAIVRAQKL